MHIEYEPWEPRPDDAKMIAILNKIISSYVAKGYTLSVRQLYYQLVARNLIRNEEREYKRIAALITKARMAGRMSWSAIEDRNRDIVTRPRWSSGKEILTGVAKQFHMDMWDNQKRRVFIVVEKVALEGVLQNVCFEYDVPLLAARGYPSVSILHQLVRDHFLPPIDNGQDIVLLHLGDHDPSGIDMTRDLEERCCTFITEAPFDDNNYPLEFEIKRIALSMDQIEETNAPPNPAKLTDTRAKDYIRRFGRSSWELDALSPEYIDNLVRDHLDDLIDPERWEEKKAEIEDIRKKLTQIATNFKD